MFTVGSELPTGVTEMSMSNQIATDWSGVVLRTTKRLASRSFGMRVASWLLVQALSTS
jgi:hypothetical protein